ncbi:MAG: hypothetical protein Q7U07_01595 [Gammaproteobacteria bacterium]|nr:hypothetical protein [Gammaproteobacteria bacterium]
MEEKKLMHDVRLCVSEAAYQQSGRTIDESRLDEIAEAKITLAQVRGIDLIPVLATLSRRGLQMEVNLSAQVRFTEEKSPGRPAGRF